MNQTEIMLSNSQFNVENATLKKAKATGTGIPAAFMFTNLVQEGSDLCEV